MNIVCIFQEKFNVIPYRKQAFNTNFFKRQSAGPPTQKMRQSLQILGSPHCKRIKINIKRCSQLTRYPVQLLKTFIECQVLSSPMGYLDWKPRQSLEKIGSLGLTDHCQCRSLERKVILNKKYHTSFKYCYKTIQNTFQIIVFHSRNIS